MGFGDPELTPEQQREWKRVQRDIAQGDAILAVFRVLKWIAILVVATVIVKLTWNAI